MLILFKILNDLYDAKFIIVFNLKILNHEIYPFLRILLEFCSFRLITNEIVFPLSLYDLSLLLFEIITWGLFWRLELILSTLQAPPTCLIPSRALNVIIKLLFGFGTKTFNHFFNTLLVLYTIGLHNAFWFST